jgi:tetratricopeptide (TPR) repeat protein
MLFRQELTAPAEADAHQAMQARSADTTRASIAGRDCDLAKGDLPGAIAELEQEAGGRSTGWGDVRPVGGCVSCAANRLHAQSRRWIARCCWNRTQRDLIYCLGKALLDENDPVTAAMYLERAVKMDPSNCDDSLMLLGRAFAAAGRRADAQREFDALQKLQGAPASSNP